MRIARAGVTFGARPQLPIRLPLRPNANRFVALWIRFFSALHRMDWKAQIMGERKRPSDS
jgi:hypothetical protein